jgi:hypothetical protein
VDAKPSSDISPQSTAAPTLLHDSSSTHSANTPSITSSLPPHIAKLFVVHVVEGHQKKMLARLSDAAGDRVRRRRCAEIISHDLWENAVR